MLFYRDNCRTRSGGQPRCAAADRRGSRRSTMRASSWSSTRSAPTAATPRAMSSPCADPHRLGPLSRARRASARADLDPRGLFFRRHAPYFADKEFLGRRSPAARSRRRAALDFWQSPRPRTTRLGAVAVFVSDRPEPGAGEGCRRSLTDDRRQHSRGAPHALPQPQFRHGCGGAEIQDCPISS